MTWKLPSIFHCPTFSNWFATGQSTTNIKDEAGKKEAKSRGMKKKCLINKNLLKSCGRLHKNGE